MYLRNLRDKIYEFFSHSERAQQDLSIDVSFIIEIQKKFYPRESIGKRSLFINTKVISSIGQIGIRAFNIKPLIDR